MIACFHRADNAAGATWQCLCLVSYQGSTMSDCGSPEQQAYRHKRGGPPCVKPYLVHCLTHGMVSLPVQDDMLAQSSDYAHPRYHTKVHLNQYPWPALLHHSISDVQVLNSSLAGVTGTGKSLLGMDLSGAAAELQRMSGECRCPLEMLRRVNEADRCLADSASRLRHVAYPPVAASECHQPLCGVALLH